MSPLQFMQRLAALVPRPRLHLIRYYGVLASNAKLRPLVVPQGTEVQEQTTEVAAASECETEPVQARPHRISWARLLTRVFDIDMQHCPELRRRGAQDHRGHPGASGHREDRGSPGPGSAAATPGGGRARRGKKTEAP
jgi:hypothetical protein